MPEVSVLAMINDHLDGCASVLDVGCGIGVYLNHYRVSVRHGVDAYKPYLSYVNAHRTMIGKAQDVLPLLESKSYDAVTCIDMIEHVERREGLHILAEMQRIASRIVIVFTPDGEHPQDKDGWNLGGDHWQTHRSAWTSSDFPPGWEVGRWPDFSYGKGPEFDTGALWATYRH